MKIGIIDDDKEFAEVLNKELEQLFSQVQIKKYQEISDELYKEEFDILFLDVLLYDKKSFNKCEAPSSISRLPNFISINIYLPSRI